MKLIIYKKKENMIKLNKEIKLKQLGCFIGKINMIFNLQKQIRKY